jgi:hypothetical protein
LSLLTNFGLKFALSDMNIAIPACFWVLFLGIFFPSSHFKPAFAFASELFLVDNKSLGLVFVFFFFINTIHCSVSFD